MNQRCFIVCSLLTLMFLVPTISRGEEDKPTATLDLKTKIDPLAKPLVDEGHLVGCAIGIIKDGRIQVLTYGETEKGTGRAPDGDTVYEIGSITKTFTAILLADMAQRGELKLDDPAQSLLPAPVTLPKRGDKAITLADLATHHSGLARMPSNFKPADPRNPYADYSVKQMYEFLTTASLARDPGASYEYSNLACGLLGHLLALKAGTEYEKLVTDRILQPLKMMDTSIVLSDSQKKRLASPYSGTLKPDANWDLPTLAGAGALRSTVNDMLKYLAANLAKDDSPLTKSMTSTHIPRHKLGGGQAIGLGWHIAADGATRWHSGQTGGYASFAAFNANHNIAVVVLANTASTEVPKLGELILRAAAGMQVKPLTLRKAIDIDEATLKTYTGTYALAPQMAITITLEAGQLMSQLTGQGKHPIYAESKTRFFLKIVDAQMTFTADEKGAITKLTLHQNGRDMDAVKVK